MSSFYFRIAWQFENANNSFTYCWEIVFTSYLYWYIFSLVLINFIYELISRYWYINRIRIKISIWIDLVVLDHGLTYFYICNIWNVWKEANFGKLQLQRNYASYQMTRSIYKSLVFLLMEQGSLVSNRSI